MDSASTQGGGRQGGKALEGREGKDSCNFPQRNKSAELMLLQS